MVHNIFEMSMLVSQGLARLQGMKPQPTEVEPGIVIHYWAPTRPASTKRTVVFLHGFGVDGFTSWIFQVLFLARTYNVYVPDFLFFGGSTTDKVDRSPEFQAECVAKSLRKLGVEKCVLVGLSYGGIVGFIMAKKYPDLVKSMVVSCSVMALTESISSEALDRNGLSCWSELLVPSTVKGVKKLFDVTTYKVPWYASLIYEGLLKILSNNRKDRVELLESLITKDKEFTIPHFSQKEIHLLWGKNDKIFNMEVARDLEKYV